MDECKGNNDCHSNATCSNTDGGHNCTCKGGFAGNGSVCRDVDECESSINDCDPNTTLCVNGIGNYLCKCRTGYENRSAGKCEGKGFGKYLGGGGVGCGEWNGI